MIHPFEKSVSLWNNPFVNDVLPISDVPARLLATLRALPGTRVPVWVLFEEDDYETRFGDGRFLYPRAAYLAERDAVACLEEKRRENALRTDAHHLGYLYHLKQAELVRDEAHDRLTATLDLKVGERLSIQDLMRLLG